MPTPVELRAEASQLLASYAMTSTTSARLDRHGRRARAARLVDAVGQS